MKAPDHLTDDLLVRTIDDELSPDEISLVESHLPDCEVCRRRQTEILRLSGDIESLAAVAVSGVSQAERDALSATLDTAGACAVTVPNRRGTVRAITWGMAIAAAILLSVLFAARRIPAPMPHQIATSSYRLASTFEVDGETFIRLPYSNPDLPVSAPHIVEMEVPASSLGGAGLVFEPVSSGISGSDSSVLADVLMGADGQPLGIHVLSME